MGEVLGSAPSGNDKTSDSVAAMAAAGMSYQQAMKAAEQAYLLAVLENCRCNKKAAARMAGISYSSFRSKLVGVNFKVTVASSNP